MRTNYNPVRKVLPSYISLRGVVNNGEQCRGKEFESSLERDYLQLLEFDRLVDEFVEQPIEIPFIHDGIKRHYTPDVLVFYNQQVEVCKGISPLLVEIKYRDDLWKNWKILKPKFSAANKYCADKGWRFKILTEKEIRTDYLANVKFLLPYKRRSVGDANNMLLLSESMRKLEMTTPQEIILASARDKNKQAELLYEFWRMVAIGFFSCDLRTPLNMKTEIWKS